MQNYSKRIFAVHLLNDFSGSPLIFKQALQALAGDGWEINLCTSAGTHGFLSDLPGVRYHTFRYRWSRHKWITLAFFLTSQCMLFFRLLWMLTPGSVVYINTVLPFGAAWAAKLRGSRVVYHIHETSIRPKILKRFLFGTAHSTASDAIYVSHYIQHAEKITGDHDCVVPNCLDGDFIARIAKDGSGTRGNHILMICSLKEYKGIFEFVRLAQSLPQYPFTLLLNAEAGRIREFFRGAKLPENLQWHPVAKDVHAYYRNAALVLNLSRPDMWVETFGMTMLEAMAYGRPVIAPPIGGIAEVVLHGVNGYLCDSRDTAQLREYVRALMQDANLYGSMSEAGLRLAENFREENFVTAICALFQTAEGKPEWEHTRKNAVESL